MKKFILAATFASAASVAAFTSFAHAASAVPCEDVLVKLEDALKTAKPSDADAKTVADLKAKGEERCTAEDDRRADAFFNDALKLLGKL